jgi:hypothetical protein
MSWKDGSRRMDVPWNAREVEETRSYISIPASAIANEAHVIAAGITPERRHMKNGLSKIWSLEPPSSSMMRMDTSIEVLGYFQSCTEDSNASERINATDFSKISALSRPREQEFESIPCSSGIKDLRSPGVANVVYLISKLRRALSRKSDFTDSRGPNLKE